MAHWPSFLPFFGPHYRIHMEKNGFKPYFESLNEPARWAIRLVLAFLVPAIVFTLLGKYSPILPEHLNTLIDDRIDAMVAWACLGAMFLGLACSTRDEDDQNAR